MVPASLNLYSTCVVLTLLLRLLQCAEPTGGILLCDRARPRLSKQYSLSRIAGVLRVGKDFLCVAYRDVSAWEYFVLVHFVRT